MDFQQGGGSGPWQCGAKARLVLMGENIIDIASKSVVGLLVDEVSISVILIIRFSRTICAGFASVLRLPNRFNYPLVP